jgi:PII-like signaling protein
VDEEERLRAVLPDLDAMVGDGLITLEKVEVIAYRATAPEAESKR